MLLETLDILENDVVIFSENKFDLENNFKVIFKSSAEKKVESINYFQVCKFITDPVPKNIIVYRLLTNVDDLDAFTTNYGYFLNTAGNMELVYFDPVFAIEDLSYLKFNLDPDKFRFKIQQVGFSSYSNENDEAIFEEAYSFDLKAPEAQNQNDKIFAEAIFALDDSIVWESQSRRKKALDTSNLAESSKADDDKMVKAKIGESVTPRDVNTKNITKLKESIKREWESGYNAYGKYKVESGSKTKEHDTKPKSFGDFIKEHKKEKSDEFKEKGKKLGDTRESIILKFKSKK